MSQAMLKHEPSHGGIVETFRFTQDQRRLILNTCCGGASEQEAQALIGIAEMRGLNPLTGECYFVQRWDSQKQCKVWAVQASIDALRIKAEETGLYAGQDEPEYEYEPNGAIKLARVRIYRSDWPRPVVGVARFAEYVQTTRDGKPTQFWSKMGHNQLAKCAEALGLRKAFPKRLAKLYVAEEMAQAETAPDPQPQRRSDPPPALHEGGESSAIWSRFSAEISQAPDLAALKAIGGTIKQAQTKLTLTQLAELRDLTKARQKALKDGPRERVEEVFANNPLPDSWQPGASDDVELCFYCKEPVPPSESVVFEGVEGEVHTKHAACTAFGKGEMP